MSPLGGVFDPGATRQYREIVGVVADVRYSGLTEDIPNNVYVPRRTHGARWGWWFGPQAIPTCC
jgi:hypothetical protein